MTFLIICSLVCVFLFCSVVADIYSDYHPLDENDLHKYDEQYQ